MRVFMNGEFRIGLKQDADSFAVRLPRGFRGGGGCALNRGLLSVTLGIVSRDASETFVCGCLCWIVGIRVGGAGRFFVGF